jgi:hypothetical protein
MANAWPRWRGAAAEPRIWLILLGGMCLTPRSRGSGATVWEALERRPSRGDTCVCRKAKGARTQKCRRSTAQSCRVSGRRPRVSESCDRSRRESITRFTPPVHFSPTAAEARSDKRDRQSDRSGFRVRRARGRRSPRTASRGRSWTGQVLVVTSRTSNAKCGRQGHDVTSGEGTIGLSRCDVYIVSRYYILLRETASGRDGANAGVGCESPVRNA